MDARMMSIIVDGKRYRTEGAELLASDVNSAGTSKEHVGRNTFLFRTSKGGYFMQHQTTWIGERDSLTPLAREEAFRVFTELPAKMMEYEAAFPGVKIEDA